MQDGDFVRPRAIAIDRHDRLYIVDFTARIQVYDRDGNYLGPTWTDARLPQRPAQRPEHRPRRQPDRQRLALPLLPHLRRRRQRRCASCRRPAGTAPGPARLRQRRGAGRRRLLTTSPSSAQDQRISKLDRDGNFVALLGRGGPEPGQFARIRALALGPDGLLYVADACNHRIQVFTRDGQLVRHFGSTARGRAS